MTPTSAQGYVVGGFAVAGVLTAVRDVTENRTPEVRTFLGVGVGALLLSLLATPLPALAAGLGLLVGVAGVLSNGAAVFGALSKGLT